jgi:hypothetical protein
MKKIWMVGVLVAVMATAAMAQLPNNHNHKKHGCVPEPASMLALGAGAVMLINRRKRA